jgi:flagellar hook-associated protein 3 FlgL
MMDRYETNINYLDSRLSLEETVLSQEFEVLTQIKELVIRSNSGTMAPNDRRSMALTIKDYVKNMAELANTKDSSGEYLFSGYKASTKPFIESGGTFVYQGDTGIRYLQTGFSTKVQSNDAGDIFSIKRDDGVKENVFKMLNDFADKLENAIETPEDFDLALNTISKADENIISTRTSLGSRLTSLDIQRSMNNSMSINLEDSRANLKDLDYAEAITRLTSQITSLQAAQQSYAKISKISLFSYMN